MNVLLFSICRAHFSNSMANLLDRSMNCNSTVNSSSSNCALRSNGVWVCIWVWAALFSPLIWLFSFIYCMKVPMQRQAWQMSLLMWKKIYMRKTCLITTFEVENRGEKIIISSSSRKIKHKIVRETVARAHAHSLARLSVCALTELILTTFECIESSNRDPIVADMWFLFALNVNVMCAFCVCAYVCLFIKYSRVVCTNDGMIVLRAHLILYKIRMCFFLPLRLSKWKHSFFRVWVSAMNFVCDNVRYVCFRVEWNRTELSQNVSETESNRV